MRPCVRIYFLGHKIIHQIIYLHIWLIYITSSLNWYNEARQLQRQTYASGTGRKTRQLGLLPENLELCIPDESFASLN